MYINELESKIFSKYEKSSAEEKLNENLQDESVIAKEAESVVAFVDIFSFSTKMKHKTPEEINNFLQEFYGILFPIVNRHNGHIDKLMGDGVIIVFSNVFSGIQRSIEEDAIKFAQECIKILSTTGDKKVKIALAKGNLFYCESGTPEEYEEITCIGEPMTKVFRIEDIAINPDQILFINHEIKWIPNVSFCHELTIHNLKGIGDGVLVSHMHLVDVTSGKVLLDKKNI